MRINRISLIEPMGPSYHVYTGIKLPRLGLPMIGTMLRNMGYEVGIFVEALSPIPWDYVLSSDLVGISTLTSSVNAANRIVKLLRSKGIKTVAGGPHFSFAPQDCKADFIVRGEGEETIVELIKALEDGGDISAIKGLSFWVDGELVNNPPRPFKEDLDSLPIPDLSLIKGHERMKIIPMMTSRGCPFDCEFCGVTLMFGRKFRCNSVDYVMDMLEMEKKRSGKLGAIFFYDDNFTADVKRSWEICEGMIRRGLVPARWMAQSRIDIYRHPDLLDLMRRTGCSYLYIGLESVNPMTLKEYNKRQELEEMIEGIRVIQGKGIRIHGMFVFGSDHDTKEIAEETVRFAIRNKLNTFQMMALTPVMGSRLWSRLEEEGRIISYDWDKYDGLHVVIRPKLMSPKEMQYSIIKATAKFYSIKAGLALAAKFKFQAAMKRFWGFFLVIQWMRTQLPFLRWLNFVSHKVESIYGFLRERELSLKGYPSLQRNRT
jgi:anaerobic magnesium-protoporphyrin IX monomethyl ester cyclase